MRKLKKLFGGTSLSWPKLLIFAAAAGVYTALVSLIPQLRDTSFHTIAVTFELWVPIGIFIIMNSRSNTDAALKCFVFFLVSQPLVYLLQVPFSPEGWGLFGYYRYWFVWTVLCLPMGFIGYYIKKDKWWGYIILFPMIALTAVSYHRYLSYFTFCRPCFMLISVFCAAAMLLYPNILFNNRKIKAAGTVISLLLIVGITATVAAEPLIYSTEILYTFGEKNVTDEYQVSIADERCGNVSVRYYEDVEAYAVHADFSRKGDTELTVTAPDGETKTYDLHIELFSFELTEKPPAVTDGQ